MNKRVCWLLGVGLLLAAFAVWRICVYVSAPELGQYADQPDRPPAPVAPTVGDDYVLANDEVIRHIPAPDPEARRELLEQLGLLSEHPDNVPIASLNIVWDGAPHLRSVEVGYEHVPRRLLRVLIHSLKIPLHRLDGIDVARGIGLSGDWVIRADADLDECMSYVEQAVQQAGYPDFHVVRRVQKRRARDMHGVAQAPEQPVQIFPQHPDGATAPPHTGTLRRFGEVLSAAIQRPLSIHAEPQDLKLTWQDNSHAYLDLGPNISDEMVSDLLTEVSAALGVTFTDSEVEMTIWQLERAKQRRGAPARPGKHGRERTRGTSR